MKPRVLIVDDERRFRELYDHVLRKAGFRTADAETAEGALRQLVGASFDMVVCDVNLPGDSGIELLSAVRARGDQVPFLLVTAFAQVRDAVTALKLGAVDYLAKPVDLDELTACVSDTLGVRETATGEDPPSDLVAPMVVQSAIMREVIREAWRVSQSDVNVLMRRGLLKKLKRLGLSDEL